MVSDDDDAIFTPTLNSSTTGVCVSKSATRRRMRPGFPQQAARVTFL